MTKCAACGTTEGVELRPLMPYNRAKKLGVKYILNTNMCGTCWNEWRYNSLIIEEHNDAETKLKYLKGQDPERFSKMYKKLSNNELIEKLC